MITYKLIDNNNQPKALNYISREKSEDTNAGKPIIVNYFNKNSDNLLAFINLIAMAERENIILSDDDCHYLDFFLDDPAFYYRALMLLNKLSVCEHNPFISDPIFLYEHLFQLLKTDQANIIFSTIGNFITKSKIYAEYAIKNDIIPTFIHRYQNEQQNMIPWIAKCFLSHQEIRIVNKIYILIDNIMENLAPIRFNTNISIEIINNYIREGFQALTEFMIRTKKFSFFIYHYCFSRNITMPIDNNESKYEQYNFVYSLTKNLQNIPINFPYIEFLNLAKSNLLSTSEKNAAIILKCIYNITLKKSFMENLIQCDFIKIFQEMLISSSFKIKYYIVLIIFELLSNNSLTIKVLDLLNIEFFDIIQDFVNSFDERTSLKIYNSFSNILDSISNEEQLAKSMQFLDSLSQSQETDFAYQIEQIILPKDDKYNF